MPTIVAADDEPDLLGLVSFRLRRAGYTVETAADGEQALRLVRELRPALCLLDVMMPKMSGLEVLRTLRGDADAELAKTRIIILTARSQEQDVEQAFALGADDYLTKPFSPQELVARVGRTIG